MNKADFFVPENRGAETVRVSPSGRYRLVVASYGTGSVETLFPRTSEGFAAAWAAGLTHEAS
jgi:hypothetical protein